MNSASGKQYLQFGFKEYYLSVTSFKTLLFSGLVAASTISISARRREETIDHAVLAKFFVSASHPLVYLNCFPAKAPTLVGKSMSELVWESKYDS